MMNKQNQQKTEKIASVIVGMLGAIALSNTLSFGAEATKTSVPYTNSFTAFLLGVFASILLWQIGQKVNHKDKQGWILAGIYSFALSFVLTVGQQLETVENWNVFNVGLWINIILLTAFFCPFVKIAWEWVAKYWKKTPSVKKSCEAKSVQELQTEKKEQRIRFLRDWLLIFLCWLPVFLAFYPGAFVYDAQDEFVQVATRTFTTHHPLTHVLLLGGFVCGGNKFLGSYNAGMALYTLFQMLVLSAVFSYTIIYIRRKIENKWAEILPVLFYGLFPVIPMYAVCSAKDGLFTAALLVVIVQMLQLFEVPENYLSKKSNVIAGILAAGAMMLFRNNGIYAYFVWVVVTAIILLALKTNKKTMGKFLGITGAGMILFLITSQLLSFLCQATLGGKQEMLTVPIQQMVRTYNYSPESYSEEDREILFEILPEEELHVYNPRLSDIIKSKFNNDNFKENPTKYLSLWIRIGSKNPLTYLNAWLMTSYGYWYPDAVINVYGGNAVHTFTYQDSSYFGFETEPPGVRESKLPVLEEFYRKLSLELYQQKVPVISMLFSPGFLFWVYAFCMFYLLWRVFFYKESKSFRKFLPLLLIFILWLTVIIGPTYLVRYVLILWFALPLFVTETKV